MSEARDLVEARQRLLAKRNELLAVEQTGREASATVELDQSRVGRLSRMDALQSQAMSQATRERRTVALRRIDAALRRIDTGDYGYCLSCDEPIGAGRLGFDPAATQCLRCASQAEGR